LDRIALSSSLSLAFSWFHRRVKLGINELNEAIHRRPSQIVEGLFSIFLNIFKLKSFPWVSSLGEMNFGYFCP